MVCLLRKYREIQFWGPIQVGGASASSIDWNTSCLFLLLNTDLLFWIKIFICLLSQIFETFLCGSAYNENGEGCFHYYWSYCWDSSIEHRSVLSQLVTSWFFSSLHMEGNYINVWVELNLYFLRQFLSCWYLMVLTLIFSWMFVVPPILQICMTILAMWLIVRSNHGLIAT